MPRIRVPAILVRLVVGIPLFLCISSLLKEIGVGEDFSYLIGGLVAVVSFFHLLWAERKAREEAKAEKRKRWPPA